MNGTSEIIGRLGGAEFIAGRFRLSTKAVEMWERRGGIPGRWHLNLLLLAEELGVSLSLQELLTTNRSATAEAA